MSAWNRPRFDRNLSDYGAYYTCPICGRRINTAIEGNPNYCADCGNKFEWKSQEEYDSEIRDKTLVEVEQVIRGLYDDYEDEDEFFKAIIETLEKMKEE